MHVYLGEGSMLRFGEMANVVRKHATANVWIYVHGTRDQVDFGPLTPQEQALFRFVATPDPVGPTPLTEIHPFPNPALASDQVTLHFPRTETQGEKKYALYSAQGKTIATGVLSVSGNYEGEIALPDHLAEGVYFLRVAGEKRSYTESLVVRAVR